MSTALVETMNKRTAKHACPTLLTIFTEMQNKPKVTSIDYVTYSTIVTMSQNDFNSMVLVRACVKRLQLTHTSARQTAIPNSRLAERQHVNADADQLSRVK